MNSENKTDALRNKKKTITHPGLAKSRNDTTKKMHGARSNRMQNASPQEFFSVKNISGYNNENLATLLGTTQRTILNKKNSGEPFDIAQTERLRKLNQLFKEGNEIFGNKEQFNVWLQKPSYGLDYDIPADLLKHPGGLDKVMNELNSIKFGEAL